MVPDQIHKDIEDFIKLYYRTVISTSSSLNNFFSPEGNLSISKENEPQRTFTADFEKNLNYFHKKEIGKILISTLDIQDRSQYIIALVVGQIIYGDSENVRFTETLLINSENMTVLNSIVRILNDEILYEKVSEEINPPHYGRKFTKDHREVNHYVQDPTRAVCIKNGSKYIIPDIINNFKGFGRIVSFEKRGKFDDEAFVEFESSESLEAIKRNNRNLLERGFDIDFDRKYIRRDYIRKGQ